MIQKIRMILGRAIVAICATLSTRYFSLAGSMKRGPKWEQLKRHSESEVTRFRHIFSGTEIVRRVEERFLFKVRDVYLFPDTGVASCDAGVIVETSSWPPSETALANPWIRFNKSHELILGDCVAMPSSAYYHWLIEDLPAFLSAINSNTSANVLVWNRAPKYVRTFLDAAGFEASTLNSIHLIESLVFTEKTGILGTPQATDIALLRNLPASLGLRSSESNRVKVYVSRRGASRSPTGERDLEIALTLEGFKVVRLEELSWTDQVKLFLQADFVVGVHGAGLANIVFCKEGTRVIELTDVNYPNNCFEILATKSGLDFSRILFDRELSSSQISDVVRAI